MSDLNSRPVYSYVVRTEGRAIVLYQRTIYLEGDASDGFHLVAKIDDEDSSIGLSDILLEDALSSDVPGETSLNEHVVEGFGHALGQSIARRLVERTPERSDDERASLALACIVKSLGASFSEEVVNGVRQYRFEHCPLCDASERTGIEEVDLAHRALTSLMKTTIETILPDQQVRLPREKDDNHVFGLI